MENEVEGLPRASRIINHRGNSIDGSLLLEGARDACQTYTARTSTVEQPAKRQRDCSRDCS